MLRVLIILLFTVQFGSYTWVKAQENGISGSEIAAYPDSFLYVQKEVSPGVKLHRKKALHVFIPNNKGEVLLPNGALPTKRLKAVHFVYDSLRTGDSLSIQYTAKDGKALQWIKICDKDKKQLYADVKVPSGAFQYIMKKDGKIHISLKANPSLYKKFVDIKVERFPLIKPDTFYRVWDTLYTDKMTRQLSSRDTFIVGVMDSVLTLSAKRNIEKNPGASLELTYVTELPDQTPLHYMAYWIGTGTSPIEAYGKMSKEIPPRWFQPGTSPPLAAYGMFQMQTLPDQNEQSVDFIFTDSVHARNMLHHWNSKTTSFFKGANKQNSYGIVPNAELDKKAKTVTTEFGDQAYRCYLSFRNMDDVNTCPVHVVSLSYYISEKYTYGHEISTRITSYKQPLTP